MDNTVLKATLLCLKRSILSYNNDICSILNLVLLFYCCCIVVAATDAAVDVALWLLAVAVPYTFAVVVVAAAIPYEFIVAVLFNILLSCIPYKIAVVIVAVAVAVPVAVTIIVPCRGIDFII